VKDNLEIFLKSEQSEVETFLFLLESREEYALDFLNCWFSINNMPTISEEAFNTVRQHVKMPVYKNKKGAKR